MSSAVELSSSTIKTRIGVSLDKVARAGSAIAIGEFFVGEKTATAKELQLFDRQPTHGLGP